MRINYHLYYWSIAKEAPLWIVRCDSPRGLNLGFFDAPSHIRGTTS